MNSNEALAVVARRAINSGAPVMETKSGYCQRFVSQCLRYLYGTRYDDILGASAKITAQNFREAGLGFAPGDGFDDYQQGDILYKYQDNDDIERDKGHVGIYVGSILESPDPLVAENSSTTIRRIRGALGYRTLKQFSRPDGIKWIVRIAPPVIKKDNNIA